MCKNVKSLDSQSWKLFKYSHIIQYPYNLIMAAECRWCYHNILSFGTIQVLYQHVLGPSTHLHISINSTVNQGKLPFSDPTHPPLCWRNTWMVPRHALLQCKVMKIQPSKIKLCPQLNRKRFTIAVYWLIMFSIISMHSFLSLFVK